MRPLLHHTAPAGWINDPYGLHWRDGAWHLYFQHVPDSLVWRQDCHWGHSVSPDLLTWTYVGDALAPDETETGCWSGSVAGDLAFYTSVTEPDLGAGRVRSVSLPTGERSEDLVAPPPGATDFRDPFVYADGAGWRMLLGCATAAEATVWAYSSPDLVTWTPDGVAAASPPSPEVGSGWECPQRLVVDGEEILLVSVWEPQTLHHLAYRLDGAWHRLTYGPCHYAGSAFTLPSGSSGLVSWLREVRGTDWTGATSLPMALSLADGRLVARPVPLPRSPAPGGVLPLVADVDWMPAPGGTLSCDGFTLTASASTVTVAAGPHHVELPWSGEPLRLVVDGPVLELYGDLGVAAVPITRTGPAPYTWTGAEPEVHALTV